MTTKNEFTGDELKTKPASTDYLEGWERIFGKPVRDEDGEDNEDE